MPGHGSFGIIRKVRRQSDNLVCSHNARRRSVCGLIEHTPIFADPLSQGNQLCQDVNQRERATACRILHPQLTTASKHCCLLSSRTSPVDPRSVPLHGILRRRRSKQSDREVEDEQSIRRGTICMERIRPARYRLIPLPLRC